jgi:mannose-6-phosphate isomerase-like protein (cupin superfamily)
MTTAARSGTLGDMELTLTDTESLTILETSSARVVAEVRYAPGHRRPPLHLHPGQDEHFEVLEGAIDVQLGDVSRRVTAGETFTVPRGTPHRMAPAGDAPARARWTTEPALDTAGWWRAVHDARAAHGGQPPLPVMARLLRAHPAEFRLAVPSLVQGPALALLAALPVGRRPAS